MALQQDPERKALDPSRVYDGFNDLGGGGDLSKSAEVLASNRYALGVNISVRDSMPRTRFPFVRLEVETDDEDLFSRFRDSFYQGSGSFYNPSNGKAAIISIIGGRVFSANPFSNELLDLSAQFSIYNDASAVHYFEQAESFLVINNGMDTPIIFDGDTIRRATEKEVPSGTIMAYGAGRLFVASSDQMSFMACDLVYGGSLSSVPIKLSARVVVGSDVKAQITTTKPHGFLVDDTVSIGGHSSSPDINSTYKVTAVQSPTMFQIAAVLTSGGAGGNVVKAVDGAESDVLRATEYTFQNERGVFRLPAKFGRITAMAFYAVQDTATGQGDLIVWGERGACSFSVAAPRPTWLNIQMQRVAIDSGCTGPHAITSVNGDVFFRSWDGIRSYRSARAEATGYAKTPLSGEVRPLIQNDIPALLSRCSMLLYDNRLFTTASPKQIFPEDGIARTIFESMVILDFDQVSKMSRDSIASYDGIWTGLNIQQLVSGLYGSSEKAFIMAYQFDGSSWHNEIWVMRPDMIGGDSWVDCEGATQKSDISCVLQLRAFTFEKPMRLKKLIRADFWLMNMFGPVDFSVFWRPDITAGWFHWLSFNAGGSGCAPMAQDGCCMVPTCGQPDAYMPQVSLGTPPVYADGVTNRPSHIAYSFQLRLEWSGSTQIAKSLVCATETTESMSGRPPANIIQNPAPNPSYRGSNEYSVESTGCDSVPPEDCVAMEDMTVWPVGTLKLIIEDEGCNPCISELEGEHLLCSAGAGSGEWTKVVTLTCEDFAGEATLIVTADEEGEGFNIELSPTGLIAFVEVDVDCVPSPLVVSSCDFSADAGGPWKVDTSMLSEVPYRLLGFEMHGYVSGNDIDGAHTVLLKEFVYGVDFEIGDLVDVTPQIMDELLERHLGVFKVFFIINWVFAGSSLLCLNTKVDETILANGIGLMLDAQFSSTNTGGWIEFLDKETDGASLRILEDIEP